MGFPMGYPMGNRTNSPRRPSRAPSEMIASWRDMLGATSFRSGNRPSSEITNSTQTQSTQPTNETERNTLINSVRRSSQSAPSNLLSELQSAPSSIPSESRSGTNFAEPTRTDPRAHSAPITIEPSSIVSLDNETFFDPGHLSDAARPKHRTAKLWDDQEKIVWRNPFPGRRPGLAQGVQQPTHDRHRHDTLTGSLSAKAKGKQRIVETATADNTDGGSRSTSRAERNTSPIREDPDAIAEAEQPTPLSEQLSLESDFTRPNYLPPTPLIGGLDRTNPVMDNETAPVLAENDSTVLVRDFAPYHPLPRLNTRISRVDDDQISPKSQPNLRRGSSIKPDPFRPGGYRRVTNVELLAAVQRLEKLHLDKDPHTRGLVMFGQTQQEEEIMIVRWH